MRAKGFRFFILLLILTGAAGCDNVQWEGIEVGVRSPPSSVEEEPGAEEEEGESVPEPVRLGPLLYLVERDATGPGARILPVAVRDDEGYAPLPGPDEVEDLIPRFPLERWEEGTRFVLFHQGIRAGTFTSDGSAREDVSYCLTRPAGAGTVELRPEAADGRRFLALRADDLDSEPSALAQHPAVGVNEALEDATVTAAQNVIVSREIPWPRSIPEIQRRIDPLVDDQGRPAAAATFVFGDELTVGEPDAGAYALFLVAFRDDDRWRPLLSWYQREDVGGKAFPGFLASHDVRGTGSPDLLLEVFGPDSRGLAVLSWAGGEPRIVYQDPCADSPGPGAVQLHR